ncbi:hypothetical protein SBA4_4950002 [Candidatus Sulfopaludibacter sp. SbA4]|nr:hypothetical protein SBA4_4950002 [Candidatus Sulfopaludibacter sp. SbA4]
MTREYARYPEIRVTVGVQKTLSNCHPISSRPHNPHKQNNLRRRKRMRAETPLLPSPPSPERYTPPPLAPIPARC